MSGNVLIYGAAGEDVARVVARVAKRVDDADAVDAAQAWLREHGTGA